MKGLIVYTNSYNEWKKIFVKAKKEGIIDIWWTSDRIQALYYSRQRQNKTPAIRLDYKNKDKISYSDLEFYMNLNSVSIEFVSAKKYLGIDSEELE